VRAGLVSAYGSTRRWKRVGGSETIAVDIRIIAATPPRDLERAIREGKFREDQFHRLNVITNALPPLREKLTGLDLRMMKTEYPAFHTGRPAAILPPRRGPFRAVAIRYRWTRENRFI